MKLEIHVHIHNHEGESLALLKEIHCGLKKGEFAMALSPEMQAFVDASTVAFTKAGESLNNISADVQRLLAASTGLSDDDKSALTAVTDQLNNLAAAMAAAAEVVPES